MPANNRKNMRTNEFLLLKIRSIRRFWNIPSRSLLLSSYLGLTLLLACSFGCAPSSSPQQDGNSSASSSDLPELTEETIRERINGAFIREVPEENGAGDPINWGFDEQEPKEFTVVEKQIEGTRATIILDIKTRSAPNMRNPRELAGRIRTEWELKTGWALRRWEIVGAENISMKYKNLPKPPAENSNR
jgi:hypothetical protein